MSINLKRYILFAGLKFYNKTNQMDLMQLMVSNLMSWFVGNPTSVRHFSLFRLEQNKNDKASA